MVTVFRFLQLKNALLLISTIFVPIVTFVRFLLLLKAFAPKVGTSYTISGNEYKVSKPGAEVILVKTRKLKKCYRSCTNL